MDSKLADRLNPEFVRVLRTSLTPKRTLFIAATTLALLAVGALLLWNSWAGWLMRSDINVSVAQIARHFGEDAFNKLSIVLLALVFVLAPATAALSFVQERVRGTAIFQQMTLLRPFDLVLGKFLGSGLVSYFIAALVLPCYFAAAVIGDVSQSLVLRMCLLLLIGGLCCQAVGILVSALLSGPTERALRGGLLVGPAVGGAGAITALVTSEIFMRNWYLEQTWYFYGYSLYPFQIILILFAFVGAWAFVGAVRQVKAVQLIPTGARTIWLFFASAEALLVGLFWGWEQYVRVHYFHESPYEGLIFYLTLNLLALAALAGGSALRRGRLREWWSGARDPLALFQRREIRNTLQTYAVALLIAETGLCALWVSYHLNLTSFPANLSLTTQLLPIALGFACIAAGLAAFVQFCALQRFRLGGWAGVLFACLFFITMLAAGATFTDKNNTPTLVNPLTYVTAICEGDPYLDKTVPAEYKDLELKQVIQRNDHWYNKQAERPADDVLLAMTMHGLLAQLILGSLCFGAAALKWRATREAILREP